jgi:carbamoyltransferase
VKILGLVAKTHDSGVALIEDGVPRLVLEEERFNREKRTKRFPKHSLTHTLESLPGGLAEIDAIAIPWDLARLRRLFAWLVARRFPMSTALALPGAHPAQRNSIVMLNRLVRSKLGTFAPNQAVPPIFQVAHHDAHAAAFFVSPFEDALVLVLDGYGDETASSAALGRGNRIERVWTMNVLHSLGMVYTILTRYLGFDGLGDEGKVMALAAYGDESYVARMRAVIRPTNDGGYIVDKDYFTFHMFGELRPLRGKFFDTFGPPRAPGAPIDDRHRAIARALQTVTEDSILHIVRALLKRHPNRNLVFSGGVALNCIANARVLAETGIERLWVPPIASDTGAPLGAALWHHHQTLGHPRTFELRHPFYGLAYDTAAIDAALAEAGLMSEILGETKLVDRIAEDLAAGRIVGLFQGRFEIGPRALGNRSILADPRTARMRDVINERIKKRESFRPFAPAVLAERAGDVFEIAQPDPFMTIAPRVRAAFKNRIAAAVHVDGTGRIQTVSKDENPRYHAIISAFERLTGVPVVINTSFNEQEPIVAHPREAVACFMRTEIDVLVLENRYVTRAGVKIPR